VNPPQKAEANGNKSGKRLKNHRLPLCVRFIYGWVPATCPAGASKQQKAEVPTAARRCRHNLFASRRGKLFKAAPPRFRQLRELGYFS